MAAVTFNSAAPNWDYAVRTCLTPALFFAESDTVPSMLSLFTAQCAHRSCRVAMPLLSPGMNYTMTVQVTPPDFNIQTTASANTEWQYKYLW